jgi:hypothetical protein
MICSGTGIDGLQKNSSRRCSSQIRHSGRPCMHWVPVIRCSAWFAISQVYCILYDGKAPAASGGHPFGVGQRSTRRSRSFVVSFGASVRMK